MATRRSSATPRGTSSGGYDGLYRLTHESWNGPAAQIRNYSSDRAGNRLSQSIDDGSTTVTTAYQYDDLNQLLSSSTGGVSTTYSHDLTAAEQDRGRGKRDGGTNFQELQDDGSGYAVTTELDRAGGLGGGWQGAANTASSSRPGR